MAKPRNAKTWALHRYASANRFDDAVKTLDEALKLTPAHSLTIGGGQTKLRRSPSA